MNKEQIQKNIDEAVTVFRDTLEKNYLKKGSDFHGIGFHAWFEMFTGKVSHTRKSNGNLRLSGELPKVMLKDEVKGLPRSMEDWRILPVMLTLFHVEPDNKKEERERK